MAKYNITFIEKKKIIIYVYKKTLKTNYEQKTKYFAYYTHMLESRTQMKLFLISRQLRNK